MDFDAILPVAQEIGVQYGVIELDESPGDPIDAVRKSFEYFYSKGLS